MGNNVGILQETVFHKKSHLEEICNERQDKEINFNPRSHSDPKKLLSVHSLGKESGTSV